MNVRCEGTIVLYHRNSIRGDTVGVFHAAFAQQNPNHKPILIQKKINSKK